MASALARQRAVDALMGQQHAAFQPELGAERPQRLAQLPEIRQRGELIEGGDVVRHGGGLSGRRTGETVGKRLPMEAVPAAAEHCRQSGRPEYAK